MTTPKSALLLGSSVRVIVTIARCLSEHGIKVHVASLLPEEVPIRSRSISSFSYLPTESNAFAQELVKLASCLEVSLIYPCGDEVLELLVMCEVALAGRVRIASPPARMLRSVLDKGETLRAADTIGIPIPKEYKFADLATLLAQRNAIEFPVIAKATRKDQSVARIRRFDTFQQLADELEVSPNFAQKVVVQEFVPGNGLGIEVLMRAGRSVALFQHRRCSELPVAGGVSVRARSEIVDSKLGEYAVRLLRALEWEGVAMVEFRHDPQSRRVVLMEVNGRYWGSLPLSRFAGLDFPWYEWQIHQGIDPTPPAKYRLVAMRWTAGDIERTVQVAGEVVYGRMTISDGLRDVCRFFTGFVSSRDAVWRWNDRSPAWIELKAVWKRVMRPQIRRVSDLLSPWYKRQRENQTRFGSARATRLHRKLTNGFISIGQDRPNVLGKRILVLCHGNIIRSPFVERRLMQLFAGVQIASAGLACIPGRPADPRAIAAARVYNVELGGHRATPLSKKLLHDADIVLTMDRRNMAMLLAAWPEILSKSRYITNWSAANTEVNDPYEGGPTSIAECYEHLDAICRTIADEQQRMSELLPVLLTGN